MDAIQALEGITERACAALERQPPAAVWKAVKGLELSVGAVWTDDGWAAEFRLPRQIFADGKAFQASLARRTREARVVAFPALSVVSIEEAVPLYMEAARLDLSETAAVSYEANVVTGVHARWQEIARKVPAGFFGELALDGLFDLSALDDRMVAALPVAKLVESVVADEVSISSFDGNADRILRLVPGLASGDVRADFAARLAGATGSAAEAIEPLLLRGLAEERHPRAEELVLGYAGRQGLDDRVAFSLVAALGHRPSLERIFAQLDERRTAARTLAFDPHHVHLPFSLPVQAGFALGPDSASQRFARYFTDAAVQSAAGAKLAHDIWMTGFGLLAAHRGTVVPTGQGTLLAADPGWCEVARRLARHKLLGPTARRILAAAGGARETRKSPSAAKKKPAAKMKPAAKKKPVKKPAATKKPTKRTNASRGRGRGASR